MDTRLCEALIFNGKDDPFVSQDDLKLTREYMETIGYDVTVLEFDRAKHGFSNPAQAFNENDAFDYNEQAAIQSWQMTLDVIKRKLL